MAIEDTPNQGSGSSRLPDKDQPGAPENDAILRNLASLMGRDERDKEAFGSNTPPLAESNKPVLPDHEQDDRRSSAENQSRDLGKSTDASSAAEIRRVQRLHKKSSSNDPRISPDQEIDVIFEEDDHQEDQSTVAKEENSQDTVHAEGEQSQSAGKNSWRNFSVVELTSLAVLLAALLCAAIMVAVSVKTAIADFSQSVQATHPTPPQSISGELVQLSGIQCYWRDRNKNDRAQEDSRILPVIRIESGKGTGALQIIFQDEFGKVRGDTHIFRLDPDTLQQSHAGISITALGTSGMTSEIQFTDHRLEVGSEANEYWTVIFKESADEENWVLIGKYRLPSDRQ